MDDRTIQQTIFESACRCFKALDDYIAEVNGDQTAFAKQLRNRLGVWDRYSGARAEQRYRLDRRLESFPQVQDTFINLLGVISDNLHSAIQSAQRSGSTAVLSHRELDITELDGHVSQSLKDIYNVVGQKPWGEIVVALNELLKLAQAVRRSSSSNKDVAVDRNTWREDDESFGNACRVFIRRRFPYARTSLSDQLSNAIVTRRRRLLYKRDHERRITTSIHFEKPNVSSQHHDQKRIRATPQLTSSKAFELGPARMPDDEQRPVQKSTLLSKPRPSFLFRHQNDTRTAGSIIGHFARSDEEIAYPPQPQPFPPNAGRDPCPYCFEPLSLPMLEQDWRSHVEEDLQIYICLSENCAEHVKFFNNSKTWNQHMTTQHHERWVQEIHLGVWYCDLAHSEQVLFSNVVDFRLHLEEVHRFDKRRIETYERRKRKRVEREASVCPLCEQVPRHPHNQSGVTDTELLGHIAGHLRSLAMFSLPELDLDSTDKESVNLHSIDPVSNHDERSTRPSMMSTLEPIRFDDEENVAYKPEAHSDPIPPVDDETNEILLKCLYGKSSQFLTVYDVVLRHLQTVQGFGLLGAEASQTLPEILVSSPVDPEDVLFQNGEATLMQDDFAFVKRIERWLDPPDSSAEHDRNLAEHHPGTGSWFLKGETYKRWKIQPVSVLWLTGGPGSGKSVLCSQVIRDLRDLVEDSHSCVIWFYFTFQDQDQRTFDGMIRSLIFQLFKSKASSREPLEQLYTSTRKETGHLHTRELAATLRKMLLLTPGVRIVLDALDECESTEEILSWLGPTTYNVSLFCTSRQNLHGRSMAISLMFSTEMEENHVRRDIRNYIRERLDHDKELVQWKKHEERGFIEKTVTAGANGMFYWAVCQLDQLKSRLDGPSLRDVLHSVPRGMDQMYAEILRTIPLERRTDAITILQFLAYSKRQLRLVEVVDIIAVYPDREPAFEVRSRVLHSMEIPRYIPYVTVLTERTISGEEAQQYGDPRLKTVTELQFAHHSMKEYLCSDSVDDMFKEDLRESQANADILQVSLAYMAALSRRPNILRELGRYPFLYYAAYYWMEHALVVEHSEAFTVTQKEHLLDAINHVFTDADLYTLWLTVYDPDKPYGAIVPGTTSPSPIYVAALGGLETSVRRLIAEGADCNEPGGYFGNALQAASYRGHFQVVQHLIDQGANMQAQGGDFGYPLEAASYAGHHRIVELLLDCGADVNAQGGSYANALQAASYAGHHRIVRLLLDCGADVNAQDGLHVNALQAASFAGHDETVELLLSAGADVNAAGGGHGDALQAASFNGHKAVVQMLLNAGADTNTQGGKDGTALQAAAYGGHDQVVQMLLDYGADVGAEGEYHGSAFEAASSRGHEKVVQVLLDADPSLGIAVRRNAEDPSETNVGADLESKRLISKFESTENFSE